MDNFVIERLQVIARNLRRNNQLAESELKGKGIYIAPKVSFEAIRRNTAEIVAELQDIVLYLAGGRTPPPRKHSGEDMNIFKEAHDNFGYGETPHGIDGTLTAFIKQMATELLLGRNAINRAHWAMIGIIGACEGVRAATQKEHPQIFIDNMNRAHELFKLVEKGYAEVIDILCDTVNFAMPGEEQPSQAALCGGNGA